MKPSRVLGQTVAALALTTGVVVGATHASSATTLSIAVSGNHFVNGSGATVRLLGVNVPSTEYACDQGWGYAAQPTTVASARAVAAWHADAVRVPLNEDCWLGINGEPSFGTAAGYRQAIETWVADLHTAGLYALLDLHWSAPGTHDADGQRPMPDDHSAAFWTSVAQAFSSDHAVVFDAYNEPYSPAANGNSHLAVSWSCWRNGGCPVPVANQDGTIDDNDTYGAVGMQALVDAIRATGDDQPIILGGLSYANDLSGWLANEPSDPDHQLAASFHNYFGESCDTTTCWNATIAPVAAHVPVVTGEFDQGYDCANPPTGPSGLTTFDSAYMSWSDTHGVSYLAWGWWVLGNTSSRCSSISDPGDNYAARVELRRIGGGTRRHQSAHPPGPTRLGGWFRCAHHHASRGDSRCPLCGVVAGGRGQPALCVVIGGGQPAQGAASEGVGRHRRKAEDGGHGIVHRAGARPQDEEQAPCPAPRHEDPVDHRPVNLVARPPLTE